MGLAAAFCLVQGIFPGIVDRRLPSLMEGHPFTFLNVGIGFGFLAATTLLFVFLRPILRPGAKDLPDFERLYMLVGRGVMTLFSKPLSWMDGIWSEIYRTLFLRVFNFLARISDRFDRNGIDRVVDQTAFSVMFLGKASARLQSGRLQDQLAWMMLLALGIFALIWFW